MVLRLVLGILALTFVPLGLVFTTIGLVAEDVDRGEPEGFLYVGLAIGAAGLVITALFAVLWRREAVRRARRRAGLRAKAEVVDVRLRYNVRSGGRIAMDVTVRIPGSEPVTATSFVFPGKEPAPGTWLEVLYEPGDPENFELVKPA